MLDAQIKNGKEGDHLSIAFHQGFEARDREKIDGKRSKENYQVKIVQRCNWF